MRILKYLAFLVLGIVSALFLAWWIFDEEEPVGTAGVEAEQLADAMMDAVNYQAWDSIPIIQWTFKQARTFQWDKEAHQCVVQWDQNKVLLDINSQSGVAYVDEQQQEGAEARALISTAWDLFNNDSFWLNAVVKVKDPGTERSIVDLENGKKGLLVHYTSGGSTPGDKYLWILGEDLKPTACKMWVDILPIGGIKFTWEDWVTLPGGAMVATNHKLKGQLLDISNLQVADDWSQLGYSQNPFSVLE